MVKITNTDKHIYAYINSFTKNNKPFFAGNEHIAKKINKSKSVVSHSISRLHKLGYLENKGNKFIRELYTKNKIDYIDYNDLENAENSIRNAENSISYAEISTLIAENSNNKMLKSAIESAENSYILIKLLISYTNIPPYSPPKFEKSNNGIDYEQVLDLYNQTAEKLDLPKAQKLTAMRKKHINARMKDCGGIDGWKHALEKIADSDFLLGKNNRGWKANLDFLLQESSFTKLMEGSYDNKLKSQPERKNSDKLKQYFEKLDGGREKANIASFIFPS